jgi:hypothetical protein
LREKDIIFDILKVDIVLEGRREGLLPHKVGKGRGTNKKKCGTPACKEKMELPLSGNKIATSLKN